MISSTPPDVLLILREEYHLATALLNRLPFRERVAVEYWMHGEPVSRYFTVSRERVRELRLRGLRRLRKWAHHAKLATSARQSNGSSRSSLTQQCHWNPKEENTCPSR